jgi:POT family proton-dependent oligopeptide transporter
MFKKHPKGLLAASLANMGERFGFYTMMAILTFFLMSKFGLDGKSAGVIYSIFYFSIYALALLGGVIADRTKNYKGTILTGIVLMAVGYLILAIPTPTPVTNFTLNLALVCSGLFVIAFGNGLFKGNLQALVGQMYDNEEYSKMRDSGFSLFYMFINVGAIFAPLTAIFARGWWLNKNGFEYNSDLPALCHQHLGGTLSPEAAMRYKELAAKVSLNHSTIDLTTFAKEYLNVFNTGYHYAFGIAIIAMLISLIIYIVNRSKFPNPGEAKKASATANVVEMDVNEVKQRFYALFAVLGVVIFFWFSFHQNGQTLSYFARDYVLLKIGSWNFAAETFQSMNPFFVVFLTPVVLGIFGWLRAKGIEPSTPRKIAIGMGIAAFAFLVMAIGSLGVPAHKAVLTMGGLADEQRVTPFLLIGTYLILTFAELFISPLGISFVSKVAPPKYQGMMQGMWLGATAIGNLFLFLGAIFYENIPIWLTWTVFVVVCVISMSVMFFMVKWLERITK